MVDTKIVVYATSHQNGSHDRIYFQLCEKYFKLVLFLNKI